MFLIKSKYARHSFIHRNVCPTREQEGNETLKYPSLAAWEGGEKIVDAVLHMHEILSENIKE
jgi:hypothetical protein